MNLNNETNEAIATMEILLIAAGYLLWQQQEKCYEITILSTNRAALW